MKSRQRIFASIIRWLFFIVGGSLFSLLQVICQRFSAQRKNFYSQQFSLMMAIPIVVNRITDNKFLHKENLLKVGYI